MQYAQATSNHFGGGLEGAASPQHLLSALAKAVLATALFRCWHIILFFIAWGTAITLINEKVTSLTIQPTLLTVVGTVLGFVVSYRTTSSFERYNEGRRYWSQIILASRTLARTVWFHVPELPPANPDDEKEGRTVEERKARNLVEKKTVINLVEAFAVAVKHYLRGEEGINYVDLYHLVKFLPSYAFPAGMVPTELEAATNLRRTQSYRSERKTQLDDVAEDDEKQDERPSISVELASPRAESPPTNSYLSATPADGSGATATTTARPHVLLQGLPPPATAKSPPGTAAAPLLPPQHAYARGRGASVGSRTSVAASSARTLKRAPFFGSGEDETELLPAALPPKYTVFDVFPFSLLVACLQRRGRGVEGKKAARIRAKNVVVTRNVPLEISMYLTSYVSTLQARKAIDVPTTNLLIATVNQLTDALTGLERILTTPIPFSYSIHLWLVAIIYVLALVSAGHHIPGCKANVLTLLIYFCDPEKPLQIYATLRWMTIPATAIISFIFFGFLVAGEEIENPFGYDKNDLNMDHFTHNIIRNELLALTAFPPPDPAGWAFSPRNDRLFGGAGEHDGASGPGAVAPDAWVARGAEAMRDALARE
ncbi:UPF0187-domain-containing protein [Phellopilus nigrolimitatus]|nr:UPF0187-domain-containing protein [Phellopilus nigrolimitatus]